MKAEVPATGVMKIGPYFDGLSRLYSIGCECGQSDCSHFVEIEVDHDAVQVFIHVTSHTKWWQKSRWKQIWDILTRGHAELQATIVMSEQTALNYAEVLKTGVEVLKKDKEALRNGK
jgi:hypothetical protein